jgi:aryl-alcohol dehydrogenase-like predicted oxidoreductase
MVSSSSTTLVRGARRMGQTGLLVSRIGYGAMELAGAPKARAIDEGDAIRFLNRLIDLGINYIDTSIDSIYSPSLQVITARMKEAQTRRRCLRVEKTAYVSG